VSSSDLIETCHLVLDRPARGDPHALMYVAETTLVGGDTRAIATSSVFHPELDLFAHRTALADLEARLERDGWERDSASGRALIGIRFHRFRS
jgi:hypothetical protein